MSKWGKSFTERSDYKTAVGAHFEDGTECRGRILFGCDGSHSRVRRGLIPPGEYTNPRIPVSMYVFTMYVTAAQARPISELDPFFLQGTASASNIFMYISRKSRLKNRLNTCLQERDGAD